MPDKNQPGNSTSAYRRFDKPSWLVEIKPRLQRLVRRLSELAAALLPR